MSSEWLPLKDLTAALRPLWLNATSLVHTADASELSVHLGQPSVSKLGVRQGPSTFPVRLTVRGVQEVRVHDEAGIDVYDIEEVESSEDTLAVRSSFPFELTVRGCRLLGRLEHR